MTLLRKGNRAWGNREGAAMVEFAITLPLLALVMFGIIEAGSAWHKEQVLATASREGARVGAIWSKTITVDTVVQAVQNMAYAGGLDTTKLTIQTLNLNNATSIGSDSIVVTTTLRFPVLSKLTGGLMPATRTVNATTVMHNE